MGKVCVILVALVSAALVGCAVSGTGPEALHGDAPSVLADSPLAWVRVGMSAAEVESLVGGPEVVEQKNGDQSREVWYYPDGAVLILRDGKVTFSFPAAGRRM